MPPVVVAQYHHHDDGNVADSDTSESDGEQVAVAPSVAPPQHTMTTRARARIIKPNPKYALFTVKSNYPELRSIQEALFDPGWNDSMTEEITNMKVT